jgi:hypothetical protein
MFSIKVLLTICSLLVALCTKSQHRYTLQGR